MQNKPTINDDTLWAEGVPYSQAYLTLEIRILSNEVSRKFYYVHADVNPATYEILNKHRKEINLGFVDNFLEQATLSEDRGYQWYTYGREAFEPEEAKEHADELTKIVIKMHEITSQLINKYYNE